MVARRQRIELAPFADKRQPYLGLREIDAARKGGIGGPIGKKGAGHVQTVRHDEEEPLGGPAAGNVGNDRKSVGRGKGVYVTGDPGRGRSLKKKNNTNKYKIL